MDPILAKISPLLKQAMYAIISNMPFKQDALSIPQ